MCVLLLLKLTWQEGDDRCVRVGTFIKVGGDLRGALSAVAADCGSVSDVAAAEHHGCDLAITLLSRVRRLAELDLRHWGERDGRGRLQHVLTECLKIAGGLSFENLIKYTQLLQPCAKR